MNQGGPFDATGEAPDDLRVVQLKRAYRCGYFARERKAAGRMWLEPHYPPDAADLAHSWLEGWGDKDVELNKQTAGGGKHE